jgi:hypothetical protein
MLQGIPSAKCGVTGIPPTGHSHSRSHWPWRPKDLLFQCVAECYAVLHHCVQISCQRLLQCVLIPQLHRDR